jgi:hypothetical protein
MRKKIDDKKVKFNNKKKTPHQTRKSGQPELLWQTHKPCQPYRKVK